MTITATQASQTSVVNRSIGRHFDDAATPALKTLNLGFVPRRVVWVNLTDRIRWEWFEGMAAGTTVKTVANGTVTLDTSDVAISPDAGSGNQSGGAGTLGTGSGSGAQTIGDNTKTQIVGIGATGTCVIAAAVILQNKQYEWLAE